MDAGLNLFTDVWNAMSMWQIPLMTLYALLAVSCISTLLTSRLTGGISYVTLPTGFVIMYATGYIANFAGRTLHMPAIDDFQRGVIFSVIGHCVGGLFMLLLFKLKEGHRGRF